MACLYKRDGSPFWWIKYHAGGKTLFTSTRLRWSLPGETRKAKALKTKKTLEELQTPPHSRQDWSWVPNYIDTRYSDSPTTKNNYLLRWKNFAAFLESRQVYGPVNLTHQHCLDFIQWRAKPDVEGVFQATKNTSLYEIKLLSLLMKEAMRRGIADRNPCQGLGIRQDKPREKPEITPDELVKIREELRRIEDGKRVWPEWMEIAFEIAFHQGCRFKETCMPLSDVDLARGTITFNAKGRKRFTTALNPKLIPLFKRLKSEGRKMTYQKVPSGSSWFWEFFHKGVKLPHLCFHSTRVTVVTRLARAGVPQSQAMRFVGHASETVHRIYQRLQVDDLGPCLRALQHNQSP